MGSLSEVLAKVQRQQDDSLDHHGCYQGQNGEAVWRDRDSNCQGK